MKKIIVLLVAFVIACQHIKAQEKLLTLDDAILRARTTLAPKNLAQLQFYGATNDYVYLRSENGNDTWMRGNYKMTTDTAFLTLRSLNKELRMLKLDTAATMPSIKFSSSGWLLTVNGNRISYDPARHQYKMLMPKELANKENAEESKAGYVAYLDNFNLFVKKIGDGDAVQVTNDGSRDIVYASSVHREEFGITKGTFWSTAGDKLAFYRMDQSMVTDYPIIDWTERPAKVNLIKYPMAGDKSHHVTVGIYNTSNRSTTWIKTGEPAEQYLTNIAWSPDDKFIYIAALNRAQNHMWFNKYDATTGNFIKTLFEETDDKYVEPLDPMRFVPGNAGQFIWQSMRDGWNHLYLYDTSGRLIRQLTKGEWEVVDVKGFDNKNEDLFYSSTISAPTDRNLSGVNIKTGINKRITQGAYAHGTQISEDGTTVIDNYSDINTPRVIQIVDVKSAKTKVLLTAPDPLAGYAKGELSLYTIQNRTGTTIYCRMYKPTHFDSTKRYPVIVYWYGGPHVQLVGNIWNSNAADYWFQYMAERGYLVFGLDPRGSDNRGKAFEQAIFRNIGEPGMNDLVDAMQDLTKRSYVDKDRMGLYGWSFGGFMTTDFMLSHPGIFKAAVAGGPLMNWQYYEVMYGERYMDTPQENPDGYAANNLYNKVANLKGKLLLIHGLQDPVVVQQHSVNFVRACIDKGVQVDYMIYPGHEHNVNGRDRVHLYQKITDYFSENLR